MSYQYPQDDGRGRNQGNGQQQQQPGPNQGNGGGGAEIRRRSPERRNPNPPARNGQVPQNFQPQQPQQQYQQRRPSLTQQQQQQQAHYVQQQQPSYHQPVMIQGQGGGQPQPHYNIRQVQPQMHQVVQQPMPVLIQQQPIYIPVVMGGAPPAPSTVMSNPVKKRTVRQIPLTPQGNLVIDVPVAERVQRMGKFSTGDEFTHMRYTAVTCSPDEFSLKGYSLRQQELRRSTELFIVVTMYNEDDALFCKSMQALMKNIAYLCSRTKSKTWGEDGWKKAIICIVSDGRSKVNPRVLDVLGIMGVFQNGIMKDNINGKPVTGHLFEYTTQVCVTSDLKVHGHEKGYVPCQILFCLKEKNAKKINSHRWFFNAFGPLIRPEVCILIDVGTKPTPTSLYHLWKAFEKNASIGGACGEIYAELGPAWGNLLNPIVAAQNFEYKMSNILDKPLESVCGYISVLPGAFSAYRYKALQGKPLEQYFHGESLTGSEDIFAANMYLAEDRILCFEIVTKVDEAWLLKYVKSAQAETDVPSDTPEFISQRRRWLNGSFFASVHALSHWYFIFRSGHNFPRKLLLLAEFFYNAVNIFFAWFNIGFFYLTFFFLLQPPDSSVLDTPFASYGPAIFDISQGFYLASLTVVVVCSLGNRPQGSKWLYNLSIFFFSITMGLMLYVGCYSIYSITLPSNIALYPNFLALLEGDAQFRDVIISSASTIGLYLVSSIIYMDPWHMITSFLQYMLFLPSYTNILNVYAFCNLHDVSWGTKGDNAAATLGGVTVIKNKDGQETVEVEMITELKDIGLNYEKFIRNLAEPRPSERKKRDAKTKMEDYFKNFRTRIVILWLFSNAAVVVALSNPVVLNRIQQYVLIRASDSAKLTGANPFLQFVFWSVFALSCVRFAGSTTYIVMRMLTGFN